MVLGLAKSYLTLKTNLLGTNEQFNKARQKRCNPSQSTQFLYASIAPLTIKFNVFLTFSYSYESTCMKIKKRPTIFVRTFNIKFHQNLPSGSQVQTWELTDEISFTNYSVYAHVQVTCNNWQSCT